MDELNMEIMKIIMHDEYCTFRKPIQSPGNSCIPKDQIQCIIITPYLHSNKGWSILIDEFAKPILTKSSDYFRVQQFNVRGLVLMLQTIIFLSSTRMCKFVSNKQLTHSNHQRNIFIQTLAHLFVNPTRSPCNYLQQKINIINKGAYSNRTNNT